jgi:hypothetical protein
VWGHLSPEKMRVASGIGFCFFFALGIPLCYSWIEPNESLEARLAAGLSYFCESTTHGVPNAIDAAPGSDSI